MFQLIKNAYAYRTDGPINRRVRGSTTQQTLVNVERSNEPKGQSTHQNPPPRCKEVQHQRATSWSHLADRFSSPRRALCLPRIARSIPMDFPCPPASMTRHVQLRVSFFFLQYIHSVSRLIKKSMNRSFRWVFQLGACAIHRSVMKTVINVFREFWHVRSKEKSHRKPR